MTLFELLSIIEDDELPLTVERNERFNYLELDCRPNSPFMIDIYFMCEEETRVKVSIYSPILIPWYDCNVKNIAPEDNNTIEVWLDHINYLKNKFPDHLIMEDDIS